MPCSRFQGVTAERHRPVRRATHRLTGTGPGRAARRTARSTARRPSGSISARNRFGPPTARSTRQGHGGVGDDRAGAAAGRAASGRGAGRVRSAGVDLRDELRGPHLPAHPHSWRPIDEKALNQAIGLCPGNEEQQKGSGCRATTPSPPRRPITCWANTRGAGGVHRGRDVPETARGQISLDLLRDLFRPVSAIAREEPR
jgi:hypothetical protein